VHNDQSERLTSDERDDLRRLFERAEVYRGDPDDPVPDLSEAGAGYLRVGGMESVLLFRDEAFSSLGSIVSRHARSALVDGGHGIESVQHLIIEATRRFKDGESSPIDWFEQQLFHTLDEYVLVDPTDVFTQLDRLRIGNCDLVGRTSDLFPAELSDYRQFVDGLDKRALVTRVAARDRRSAERIARDRFDEAHAILAAIAPSADLRDVRSIYLDPATGMINGWTSDLAISPLEYVDRSGDLYPGYRQLSEAVQKPVGERTEWERRVIAAVRWHYMGRTSPWTTGELAAYMAALEGLMIKDVNRGKGNAIAKEVNKLSPTGSVQSRRNVGRQLPKLYGRRSGGIHEGIAFEDELEIGRVLALSTAALKWGIRHLDPWHKGVPRRPCVTFEDAHSATHDEIGEAGPAT
jgi:hypothetical protein